MSDAARAKCSHTDLDREVAKGIIVSSCPICYIAEQTAALREENARLRGALRVEHLNTLRISPWTHRQIGDADCATCALLTAQSGAPEYEYVEGWGYLVKTKARALLADPEGQ